MQSDGMFILAVKNCATCPLVPISWIIISYFIGGIPFGYLVGKSQGIDIRTLGSGNIGATNVFRTMGKKWGILVFIADLLKAYIPTKLVLYTACAPSFISLDGFAFLVGLAALLGHTFTPYLHFKGGKGVASSTGMILAMMPLSLAVSTSVWACLLIITRYVSVASIAAALALPTATFFFYPGQKWFLVASFTICLLVLIRHRDNMKRLIQGTENKIKSFKK
jgi:glycerol-3-phosphate acyltransferase PlsY